MKQFSADHVVLTREELKQVTDGGSITIWLKNGSPVIVAVERGPEGDYACVCGNKFPSGWALNGHINGRRKRDGKRAHRRADT
jgi:3-dehydroquinate synthase class II